MSRAPQRLPRSGRARFGAPTALLFLLFAVLSVYQLLARNRERAEAAKAAPARPVALSTKATPLPQMLDWPQWRGRERDGISGDTGLRPDWPEGGPPLLWEQPSGKGFSSVVVTRGRAFTLVQHGDEEALVCWSASTGKKHFRFGYPCNYRNPFGDGPRATPTIADEQIYIVGATGIMHCLKAFSTYPEVIWKKDLLTEFHAPVPQWGVSGSPLVEGDLVFVQPGGPAGNSVVALNKDSGDVVWHKHDYPAGYSSPIAATFAGRRQVLFFTATHLIGVVPETGDLLWEYSWPTANHCNIATPIVTGDHVLITSGYEMGAALLEIVKTDSGWRVEEVYKTRRLRDQFSTPVLYQGHVYGFDEANLVCLELSTGKVCWKERGFEKGSLLVANGRLIIYGANGLLALADADPIAYREHGRFRCSEQDASCWSVPALAASRLYVRDQEKVRCYDVRRPPER
jgi:outer membrane protein assembly factor BamB